MLIANDSGVILYGLGDLFKPAFNVVLAVNGFEAVNRVKERPREFFDAIILDVAMPIMSGLEACVQIREFIYNKSIAQAIMAPSAGASLDDSSDTIRDVISPRQMIAWKQERRPLLYCYSGDLNPNILVQVERAGFTRALSEVGEPQV